MYTRSIDVKRHEVFLPEHEAIQVDCSSLLPYVFYAETLNESWLEEEPFTGRIYNFDRSLVETLFSKAQEEKARLEQLAQEEEERLAQLAQEETNEVTEEV